MARLHMKMLDGDRSEGVLKIADKVKLLPVTQASINGTLRIQFIKVKLLIFLAQKPLRYNTIPLPSTSRKTAKYIGKVQLLSCDSFWTL